MWKLRYWDDTTAKTMDKAGNSKADNVHKGHQPNTMAKKRNKQKTWRKPMMLLPSSDATTGKTQSSTKNSTRDTIGKRTLPSKGSTTKRTR